MFFRYLLENDVLLFQDLNDFLRFSAHLNVWWFGAFNIHIYIYINVSAVRASWPSCQKRSRWIQYKIISDERKMLLFHRIYDVLASVAEITATRVCIMFGIIYLFFFFTFNKTQSTKLDSKLSANFERLRLNVYNRKVSRNNFNWFYVQTIYKPHWHILFPNGKRGTVIGFSVMFGSIHINVKQ